MFYITNYFILHKREMAHLYISRIYIEEENFDMSLTDDNFISISRKS